SPPRRPATGCATSCRTRSTPACWGGERGAAPYSVRVVQGPCPSFRPPLTRPDALAASSVRPGGMAVGRSHGVAETTGEAPGRRSPAPGITTASSDSFNSLPGPRQALPGPQLGKRLAGREAPGPARDTRTRLRTGQGRRGGGLLGGAAGEQLEQRV